MEAGCALGVGWARELDWWGAAEATRAARMFLARVAAADWVRAMSRAEPSDPQVRREDDSMGAVTAG